MTMLTPKCLVEVSPELEYRSTLPTIYSPRLAYNSRNPISENITMELFLLRISCLEKSPLATSDELTILRPYIMREEQPMVTSSSPTDSVIHNNPNTPTIYQQSTNQSNRKLWNRKQSTNNNR